jgi:hypothetical protein
VDRDSGDAWLILSRHLGITLDTRRSLAGHLAVAFTVAPVVATILFLGWKALLLLGLAGIVGLLRWT